jgi:hypothetical protein
MNNGTYSGTLTKADAEKQADIEGVVCQSLDGIESTREGFGTALEDTWD